MTNENIQQKLSELLKCCVCFDLSNNNYLLNECLHTICYNCMMKISKGPNVIKCPYCRVSVSGAKKNLDRNDVIAFISNDKTDDSNSDPIIMFEGVNETETQKLLPNVQHTSFFNSLPTYMHFLLIFQWVLVIICVMLGFVDFGVNQSNLNRNWSACTIKNITPIARKPEGVGQLVFVDYISHEDNTVKSAMRVDFKNQVRWNQVNYDHPLGSTGLCVYDTNTDNEDIQIIKSLYSGSVSDTFVWNEYSIQPEVMDFVISILFYIFGSLLLIISFLIILFLRKPSFQ